MSSNRRTDQVDELLALAGYVTLALAMFALGLAVAHERPPARPFGPPCATEAVLKST